ncbi:proliferation marker protein Ki-67 isoform X6 [Anas acuta]|uniref:proliferation marker protein Ki-67 isoform X6 n=1 Tax=Anas acuta TaxID=28680 RepID=UPI0035C8AC7A
MPLFGKIIVIKRNGTDGIHFPLTASSCLFGRLNCLQDLNSFIQLRRTECDIRIQLPQVSKEHCKIEVNENEEAILTNLSTVNPTQLNGSCFQQPVPLKHGDVLTIIDRSFRFEYPLQSTPRKRRSRSPKDETRQVLHVQQVAEVELLHKQTSGSKRSSDHSECEEQNADENKQSTEENISKALPVKLQTPKSSYKIKQSTRKQTEMSPFSKLYETLKHEIKVKKTLQGGNVPEKAGKEGGKGALQEPSAQIASSCDHVSPTEEKEIGISENNEEYKMKQEVISSELNQISMVGSATKKCFTRSPRTSVSKEMTKSIRRRSNLQDHKEESTPGKSKGAEVTAKTPKPSKENDRNAACLLQPCSIERLGYADEVKIYNSAITAEKIAQTTNMTNISEVDKHVMSTPTPRRKSPRSCFMSPTNEATGVDSVNIGTPTARGDVLLEHKSFSEISAEIQREDSVCRNDSLQQQPLAENKCINQRRNSKQHTPRKSGKVEVLKEICDQTNVDSKKRDSESPASNSKSPRRNVRQSKEFVNKSIHSETPTSGELTSELASPASQKSGSGRKRGRPRTSELRTEKALETNAVEEHDNKTVDRQDSGTQQDLATNGCNQKSDLEDTSVLRPRRSSSKRSLGSASVLEGNEAVSEMNVSDLLAEEESGNTKTASQKRKSDDLLPQPLGKRKRVSFGGHLSPELFDKSLPPNSPLKRGAIPARLSLPFGGSPRAVLKKAQGLKHFAVQELSVCLQKEKMSPEKLPAQTPPAASSPHSGKATPQLPTGSPAPYTKGRFSVSHITTPSPIAEEQNGVAKDMNTGEKNGALEKTPKSNGVSRDDKTSMATPNKLTRSSRRSMKKTPMKRRSGAVAVISSKRRSGASTANLLVAKSWAEVVKLGVARPQAKAVKKRAPKRRPMKKTTQSPKTPERKIKGHFSTGHAESPATIVVGRAHSTTGRMAGQVPKVVKNPISKQNLNMDESFTGLAEMFKTPENTSGKTSPSSTVRDSDLTPPCTTMDISELRTPEESGEMMVSPLNTPDSSGEILDCQDISDLMREKESPKSIFEIMSSRIPERRIAMLEEDLDVDSVSVSAEKQASRVKLASKRKTPDQKLESVNVVSGIKQLLRTPKKKPEPVEVLSGIKQLMKTPKQKPEPAEVLSGIKQLMETPKQKPEPAEVLSGIKQLRKTPKQKPEPAEVLSGIKQLMKTPKQKTEPVEALSGIKQLMKTPKQKPEPAEVLSGIKQLMKTPKQKPEPAEVPSGIKQLRKTPKQKPEPAEVLSGIKQLMKTPKQKTEPVEALSGIKQLMKTPKQKPEPAEVLTGIKQLMKTPKQKPEPAEVLSGIKQLMKTPKQKPETVEALSGIKQLMKTPKQKPEPAEVLSGIKQLMKTPKQKPEPAEVLSGIKQLMKTPKQKPEPAEVRSENVMDPKQEDAVTACTNGSREYGGNKTVLEDKGNTSQDKDSQQKLSTSEDHSTQRLTRGRPRKTVHPPSTKQCEKDLNSKELQGLEKKSIQEEMGEISTSTSVAKNTGRGRRTNLCMEKEIVSKHPDEKTVETVSLVETQVDTRRPRRGKTKEPKELKHPSEDLESSEKDSSVLQKDPANRKQALQEYDISSTSVTEDDQSRKTEGVSSSTQDENHQLQTDLKKSENASDKGSVEDREEILLSHQKRSRGMKKIENTEVLLPPKRQRRARNEQVEQAPSEELHGTTRKLRKHQSAKLLQGDEQTSETAPTEASGNRTELEVKVTEKRGKSSRNARKQPTEVKTDMCGMALENTQNVQKAKETSNETITETKSPTKNERKISLGDEAENAQENTTKASQRLKSESSSGETDKMPVTVLNLEFKQEANRTRSRRGKKDSSEKKADEFAQDVNSLDLTLKCKSETEESSPKESSASSCVKQAHQVMKDQNNTADTLVTALNSDGIAHRHQKQTRNEQEANEPKQTEILQENQTQNNRITRRRLRGRRVNFKLEEASSEALGEERNLPGNEEGMACKHDQREASENPLEVRRSRRRQADSIPQAACSAFTKKETLIKDHSKDETSTKDQDPALEAIPSSTEEVPLRGRRRREVAVASQTVSSLSIREKRGLLEGDDKKMTVKEDQNPALGDNTLQAKANASARDKRKEIDLAAEAKSSASLWRKRGLSETDDKEESTNEEQNVLLESVSCAKAKPLGRGRRKETPPVSHTTNSISLRRKRGLPADNGKEEALKDQNVPLGAVVSSLKDQPKRGRRNEAAILLEATSSTPARGKRNLSKESSRNNNHRKAKKMISEKPSSEEKIDLSKGYSGKKCSITSLAVSSSSLQGLPEDGKNETPKEQQGILLEVTQSGKENPSKAGRRKIVPSKSEETSSTFLREKLVLPEDRGQNGILKEGEGTALENNSSQEKHRQLRNKRKNVQFKPEAATSLRDNGNLPENGNISEMQCMIPTGSEESNQSGKGKEVNPTQQTTSTSRRRKCLLPADDVPPKKSKSENDENGSPKKGKRNKTEEKLEGNVKTTQTAGGTNRTTRSSTRASARTRK